MKKIEEKEKMSREEIQTKAVQLSLNNNFMVLQYPTGLGKSYTVIQILDNIIKNNSNYKCLILEPEIPLIDNLKQEFIKFNKEYLLNSCDIICYASLHKIKEYYEIIILDEAHHAFSDLRLDWFQNLKAPKYMYLLSATLETYQIKMFDKIIGTDFLVHRISLKRAIEWGILPSPKIGVFKLKLNDCDKNCFYEYKRGDKNLRKQIIVHDENKKWKYIKDRVNYPNLHLIIYCTEQQKYKQLCYESETAKKRFIENKDEEKKSTLEKYWLYSELCIKRFLAEIKTPYLDEFLQDVILDNNRFIVFFGSVNQAEELAKKHNANLIASKNKESQDLIKKFNNKEISNLYCCKMLSEGVTLTDLEIGVIGQLDGKSGSFVQRIGRSLRNKYPQIYIFYYQETKDENYLDIALQKIDKNYVTYLDYFI